MREVWERVKIATILRHWINDYTPMNSEEIVTESSDWWIDLMREEVIIRLVLKEKKDG